MKSAHELAKTSEAAAECDLCHEIRLDGAAVTGQEAEGGGYSRLISRTAIVDVMAGLGAVEPGYVLVIARQHARSMGELPLEELRQAFDAAWTMAARMEASFGCSVILVEHGSSGRDRLPSGACIDHAHMHLFPVGQEINPGDFAVQGSRVCRDLDDLASLARDNRSYYFVAMNPREGYLAADPKVSSQHARKIWARAAGKHDQWDWAACPFLENARLTAMRLRSDKLPFWKSGKQQQPDEKLLETLRAYDVAAEVYAERTRYFPDESTLRHEMDWLASETDGPILDAGAGGGRDAQYMSETGRTVVALDASALLLAHVPLLRNIVKVFGDVRKMPLDDRSVGAVWCSAVLLHLGPADVVRALREFFRVVRPGGLIQISVKEGTGESVSRIADQLGPRRHFFLYQMNDLREFARLANLELVRSWSEVERDSAEVMQKWIKVLLRRNAA
jgi:SAM-dependent methyltransferase/diadenosine tetraphosphate (Ap4A) HIT family hydrolase